MTWLEKEGRRGERAVGGFNEIAMELEGGRGGTFAEFWAAYPKRLGSNPKAPAEKKFKNAVKGGADPLYIISSAKAYADELREQGKIGTEFVCQAQTWLNQKRWEDYQPDPGGVERQAKLDADMAKRGWKWDGLKWIKLGE